MRFSNLGGLTALWLALVTVVFTAFGAPAPFESVWLLPIGWLAAFLVLGWRPWDKTRDRANVVELLLLSIITIRYFLLPIAITLGLDEYAASGTALIDAKNYSRGTWLMVAELGAVLVGYRAAIRILARRPLRLVRSQAEAADLGPRREGFAVWWLLVASGLMLLVIPEVRSRFTFVTTEITLTARELTTGYDSGYDTLAYLANLARLAAPILAISTLRRVTRVRAFHVVLVVLGCLLPNLIYVSTSRASVVIPLIAAFLTLLAITPRHRALVGGLMACSTIFVFAIMTYWKTLAGTGPIDWPWIVDTLSIYFLGPAEYAAGLAAADLYASSATISTLYNDFVGNIPLLSATADPLDRTSQFYNWVYYGDSHLAGGAFIVPASIQGVFYLGLIFGPVSVGVIGAALAWLSSVWSRHNLSLGSRYVCAFAIVSMSIYYANSVSATMNVVTSTLLPLAILAYIQSSLNANDLSAGSATLEREVTQAPAMTRQAHATSEQLLALK